jgi:hypothetical protein
MFKLQITLDRHDARQKLNYYLLPDPPNFSLPSTFKVASVTYFPPTERGVNSPDRKVGRGGRGWMKGGKLGGSRFGSVMRLRDEVSDEVA